MRIESVVALLLGGMTLSGHTPESLGTPGVRVVQAAAAGGMQVAKARTFTVGSVEAFDQASAAAKPGDEIVFARGIYSDVRLNFRANGTESAPITLRAETPGQVIFRGRSQLFIEGNWLVATGFKYEGIANVPNITTPYNVQVGSVVTFRKTANHSRLTETAIVDPGSAVSGYVHMEPGGQHNRIDHCWFSGQTDIGPSLYIEVDSEKPNHAVMEACFIGNRRPGTGNRWETLRIGHSEQQYFRSNALITRNYFTKCDGENEMVSNKSTGNKYLYNNFTDNRGELTLRHGDEAWIEGNFFDNSTGIRVIGSRHVIVSNYLKNVRFGFNIYAAEANPKPTGYARVVDLIIAFNTVEDAGTAFQLGTSGRPVPPSNVRVAYNLVRSVDTVLEYANAASEVRYAGNIMFGGNLGAAERTGIHREPPVLVKDTLGLLVADRSRLPFTVEASAYPQAAKDLNGIDRGSAPNIGAIQSPNAKPRYPLSAKDVGPAWMGRQTARARADEQTQTLLSAVANPAEGSVEILLPDFRGRTVSVQVADARGRVVRRLQARSDRIRWDGHTQDGAVAQPGTYRLFVVVDGMRHERTVLLR